MTMTKSTDSSRKESRNPSTPNFGNQYSIAANIFM
jgi:hypothetical protein